MVLNRCFYPVYFTLVVILSGCSVFDRHEDSGYKTRASQRISQKSEYVNSSSKLKLRNLENSLSTKKELAQYSKVLPYFESDEEKIEFLEQDGFENKQKWLNQRQFAKRPMLTNDELRDLVEAQDITVGMPQPLVKKSWGDPESIEISGNPLFKNERWRYTKTFPTQDGFKTERKVVYFEGGKVVGWEVE